MRTIDTAEIPEDLTNDEKLWVYNGLDCMVTKQLLQELEPQLTEGTTGLIYQFEKGLLAPAITAMRRGVRVDMDVREQLQISLSQQHTAFSGMKRNAKDKWEIVDESAPFQRLARAIWRKPINPNSPAQLKQLLYEYFQLPYQYKNAGGKRTVSTDREALESLANNYLRARPFCRALLHIRDLEKKLTVVSAPVGPDGRMRFSFNIAGTETGRWSSSKHIFDQGMNFQNITKDLRAMFIPDDGYLFIYPDLEQAESRGVAYLSGDESYINACEGGDLHTTVARMVWPERPWDKEGVELDWPTEKRADGWYRFKNGQWDDKPTAWDRLVAECNYYRQFSYRDLAKRGGHGCLTSDHEVLTRSGWVNIGEKPSEILQWSDSKSEFVPVQHWTDHLYTGCLQEFEGNSISAVMTHDHRVPYRSDNRSQVRERAAMEGPGRFMPLGHGYVGGSVILPARLIAAFMADGYQKSKNRMEFHLKKTRKIARLKDLCQYYGYTFEVKPHDKYIVHGNLPKKLNANCLNWRVDCIEDFLDEYPRWDGHVSKTSTSVFSSDLGHLQWIQTLNRLCGYGGNIQRPHKPGYPNSQPSYRLQVNNRRWATGACVKHTKSIVTSQRVFCPTVPSGWFYVRRNGKIFVTGNTNYFGTARTMARHLKVEEKLMHRFMAQYYGGEIYLRNLKRWKYDDMLELPGVTERNGLVRVQGAFPGIRDWHNAVRDQLQTEGVLTTPLGRRRQFWGRLRDDATLREAIAFVPQSLIGDILNIGVYRFWKTLDPEHALFMGQVHDAILGQVREDKLDEVIPMVEEAMTVPVPIGGRTMVIPIEHSHGRNWKEC